MGWKQWDLYTAVYDVLSTLSEDMINMLPAVHTLTGCDTTSKVGTKKKALSLLKSGKYTELKYFGATELLDTHLTKTAESFLVKCMPSSSSDSSFDELRHHLYHASKLDKLQVEKLPCCSSSLHFHNYIESASSMLHNKKLLVAGWVAPRGLWIWLWHWRRVCAKNHFLASSRRLPNALYLWEMHKEDSLSLQS